MRVQDLFVEIMVGDWNLPEYEHEEENGTYRAQCWIPSSRGNFRISYGLRGRPKRGVCLSAELFLDDEYVATFVDDERLHAKATALLISGTTKEGKDEATIRPLCFTTREFTDNENEARPIEGLGTIKVVLEWKRWVRGVDTHPHAREQPYLSKPVHTSKANILRSNDAVGLGAPLPDDRFPGIFSPEYEAVDAGYMPHEFVFHYAPESWIEKKRYRLVAPREHIPYEDYFKTTTGSSERSGSPAVGTPRPSPKKAPSDKQRKKRPTLDDAETNYSGNDNTGEAPMRPSNKRAKTRPRNVTTAAAAAVTVTASVSAPTPAPEPSSSNRLNELQARRAQLGTRAQQLRVKAGDRSTLESDQAGSAESDYLLALQLLQLANEHQDLIRGLVRAGASPSGTPPSSFQTVFDKLKLREKKLGQRIQDFEDDANVSQVNRLRLILEVGQLVKALEDLVREL